MAKKKEPKQDKEPTVQQWLDHGVSQSDFMTLVDCKQKLKLSMDGFTPRQVSTPLAYGSLGHDCLEKCYNSLDPETYVLDDPEFVMGIVDSVIEEHLKEHSEYGPEMREKIEHWHVQLRVTLSEYFLYYGNKEEEWEWLGLERPIPKLPFGETFLQGKLDGVYKMSRDRIGFMDHKFKAQISEDTLTDTLETDFQLLTYGLAIRQEYGKLPSVALYNCIRRPGLKVTKKETLQQHEVRLREHVQKDPDHYFKRFEVPFDKTMLVEFEKDLATLGEEYVNWVKEGRPCRKYGNPCNGRYGVCKFYGLCHRDEVHNYVRRGYGGYRPLEGGDTNGS